MVDDVVQKWHKHYCWYRMLFHNLTTSMKKWGYFPFWNQVAFGETPHKPNAVKSCDFRMNDSWSKVTEWQGFLLSLSPLGLLTVEPKHHAGKKPSIRIEEAYLGVQATASAELPASSATTHGNEGVFKWVLAPSLRAIPFDTEPCPLGPAHIPDSWVNEKKMYNAFHIIIVREKKIYCTYIKYLWKLDLINV